MSNWLPDSPFWDPRLHETLLQEALLPEGIREHFKPSTTRVTNKSTSWLLAAHESQTTLMCLHLLHSKKELLYLHDHRQFPKLAAHLHRRLSVIQFKPIESSSARHNEGEVTLELSFGAGTVDMYHVLRYVQDVAECPDVLLKQAGCGWYSVHFKEAKVQQFLKLLHTLGTYYLEPTLAASSFGVPWKQILPQMHLHNVLLQQLLLSKQDLDGRLSELECKERHSTNAAALSDAIGQSRKTHCRDNATPDLYEPSKAFVGDWLTRDNFAEGDVHITSEAAVELLRKGHFLCKESLPMSVRNVCSSAGGKSTLDWLIEQRSSEEEDSNRSVQASNANQSDVIDMEHEAQELDIVNENNPLGVWPVSMTRPLTKLRLGRVKGRFHKQEWYQQRWKYFPVVWEEFESNKFRHKACAACTEKQLETNLLAATTYMANRRKLHSATDAQEMQRLKEEQKQLLSIMNQDGAFSWQPLWLKRDTISQSIKWMKAYSVWTNIGSMVHEHLYSQAFFTSEQLEEYEVDQQKEDTEHEMVPGKPPKELFVPNSAVTETEASNNTMAFDSFCMARFPKVEDKNRYDWAANRPTGGYELLGLDYAENAIQGLQVAVNSIDAKRQLFLSDVSNLTEDSLQQCTVHVKHIAPEYPVLYPFGLSSASGDTDKQQSASGYETRIDSVIVLELRSGTSSEGTLKATRVALLEYKMRMEITALGAAFSNRDIPRHLIDLMSDTDSARNYYRSTVSRRSQLQAESNAWMLYLDTGLLPSFCIVLSATRRRPPQASPKDPANQQRDLSHNCVRTAEARRKSAFVCGMQTLNMGRNFAPYPEHEASSPRQFYSSALDATTLQENLVLPVPCCIVAIRKFDVRETYLLDMLNRMCFRPYRGGSNKPGVTSYVDRDVVLPNVESTLKQETLPSGETKSYNLDLCKLIRILPTCELSRAVIAALQRSRCRFGPLSEDQNTCTLRWVQHLTAPENIERPGTRKKRKEEQAELLTKLSVLRTYSATTNHNCMLQTSAELDAQVWSLEQLREHFTEQNKEHPLLYGQYLAETRKDAYNTPSDKKVVVQMNGNVVTVLMHMTDYSSDLDVYSEQGVQMAIRAALSAGLFRQNCIVPIRRTYPQDELAQHAAMRKEWTSWVEHMALSVLEHFEMQKHRHYFPAHGNTSTSVMQKKRDTCKQLTAEASQAHLEAHQDVLGSKQDLTSVLHGATCAALTSMDAEDFYGLTLIAGHHRQLAQLANNQSGQEREYKDLVVALKRALCKLHANLSPPSAPHNEQVTADDVADHWHWDVLATLHPLEHFGSLNVDGHVYEKGRVSFGDMHKFNPVPNQRGAGPRPSSDELLASAGLSGSPLFQNPNRREWVEGYTKQLNQHKAHSITRMVHRVFNSRVLAAVQAMVGETGHLVHCYEGNAFDLHSFSHMSQRAYWAPGVMSFCDYRPPSSQAVQAPYWLQQVFQQCVQELMAAASLSPAHSKHIENHGAAALPLAPGSEGYRSMYRQNGIDVLTEQTARLKLVAEQPVAPRRVAHPVAVKPVNSTYYVTKQLAANPLPQQMRAAAAASQFQPQE